MLIRKLIIGLLSFYTVEIKRHVKNIEVDPFHETQIERVLETRKRKEVERKKARLYENRKWKKKKEYHHKKLKLAGTHPKDVRFSNQQKLRRMFRNM